MRTNRAICVLSVPALLVAFLLAMSGFHAPSASASTFASGDDGTFVMLLNQLRAQRGLAPLSVDGHLSDVAARWTAHLAGSQVLAHNPGLTGQVQGWAKIGENVGTGDDVNQIFRALVASPEHLRNMVDPVYTEIGTSTLTDRRGRLWTTHVFERPYDAGGDVAAIAPVARPSTTPPPPTTSVTPPPTIPVTPVSHSSTAVQPTSSPASDATAGHRFFPLMATSGSSRAASGGSFPATRLALAAVPALLILLAATFLVRRYVYSAPVAWRRPRRRFEGDRPG